MRPYLAPIYIPKLSKSLEQLVTSLTGISDLLQGCPNNSDTFPLSQDCHKVDNTRLQQYCYIMTVSVLLEQPCNKSDSPIKLVTTC